MTTAFRDFLREQAEKHKAEVEAGKATVEEWRAAIERLFEQIRAWLRESDPEGVIEIEEGKQDITEPGLGRYRVPRLDMRVFGKWIGIIPKARKTVGTAHPPQKAVPQRAAGRVDITDELRRYILYRSQEDGRDVWFIDDLQSEQKPLDQATFERALMSYLR
ncbi:MAG TPA: hypothetical protein VG013_09730 [Gemmataceae bacterium]|jgi:hypothetical protein|nr:hypothetical protein [Gemmataceae bacterium]HZY89975.1 hypothetical protein [Gemmataceae bacterium]